MYTALGLKHCANTHFRQCKTMTQISEQVTALCINHCKLETSVIVHLFIIVFRSLDTILAVGHVVLNFPWYIVCTVHILSHINPLSDIDECIPEQLSAQYKHLAHNCHDDASCSNTNGSYYCTCHKGYSGDGVTCIGG